MKTVWQLILVGLAGIHPLYAADIPELAKQYQSETENAWASYSAVKGKTAHGAGPVWELLYHLEHLRQIRADIESSLVHLAPGTRDAINRALQPPEPKIAEMQTWVIAQGPTPGFVAMPPDGSGQNGIFGGPGIKFSRILGLDAVALLEEKTATGVPVMNLYDTTGPATQPMLQINPKYYASIAKQLLGETAASAGDGDASLAAKSLDKASSTLLAGSTEEVKTVVNLLPLDELEFLSKGVYAASPARKPLVESIINSERASRFGKIADLATKDAMKSTAEMPAEKLKVFDNLMLEANVLNRASVKAAAAR
jgi:hypothetical protein